MYNIFLDVIFIIWIFAIAIYGTYLAKKEDPRLSVLMSYLLSVVVVWYVIHKVSTTLEVLFYIIALIALTLVLVPVFYRG